MPNKIVIETSDQNPNNLLTLINNLIAVCCLIDEYVGAAGDPEVNGGSINVPLRYFQFLRVSLKALEARNVVK